MNDSQPQNDTILIAENIIPAGAIDIFTLNPYVFKALARVLRYVLQAICLQTDRRTPWPMRLNLLS